MPAPVPGPLLSPPTVELAAEDGYEYGGGGPEYKVEGLISGGGGMFRAEVTGGL